MVRSVNFEYEETMWADVHPNNSSLPSNAKAVRNFCTSSSGMGIFGVSSMLYAKSPPNLDGSGGGCAIIDEYISLTPVGVEDKALNPSEFVTRFRVPFSQDGTVDAQEVASLLNESWLGLDNECKVDGGYV